LASLSYKEIVRIIADRHGVTEEEVRNGLEACIDYGITDPNPEVKAQWTEMAQGKERPSVPDLLSFTAGMAIARCIEAQQDIVI